MYDQNGQAGRDGCLGPPRSGRTKLLGLLIQAGSGPVGAGEIGTKFDLSSGRRVFWNMDHLERITLEPDKRAGKPCIRGLRITVYDVLEYMASGMTEEEILADLPDLEPEDIRAVLAFAAAWERRLDSIPPG